MKKKAVIIPFANQKGGVAKTTSAVTLGHGLATKGFRTLIVDTDPQGHVALSLGLEKTPGLQRLIYDEEPLANVVVEARPNLWIVPGDKSTEKVKRYIASMDYRERIFLDVLDNAPYDVVILDMAPSLDVLHVAALIAADWVLIPTKLDALAIDGVNEILKSHAEALRHGSKALGYSVLPTFFDRVTKETLLQLQTLVEHFKEHVWPPISTDTKAREAPAYGQTLWEYAPSSSAIVGYTTGNQNRRVGGYAQVLDRLMEVINAT